MKRKIEIFVSDCPLCEEAIKTVKSIACEDCEIEISNIKNDANALEKSKAYNIKQVPSVAVDGKLASCCKNGGIDIEVLKSLGVGKKINS